MTHLLYMLPELTDAQQSLLKIYELLTSRHLTNHVLAKTLLETLVAEGELEFESLRIPANLEFTLNRTYSTWGGLENKEIGYSGEDLIVERKEWWGGFDKHVEFIFVPTLNGDYTDNDFEMVRSVDIHTECQCAVGEGEMVVISLLHAGEHYYEDKQTPHLIMTNFLKARAFCTKANELIRLDDWDGMTEMGITWEEEAVMMCPYSVRMDIVKVSE